MKEKITPKFFGNSLSLSEITIVSSLLMSNGRMEAESTCHINNQVDYDQAPSGSRTIMAVSASGLGGWSWFKSVLAGSDIRNAT
jgi:hypothetical protein